MDEIYQAKRLFFLKNSNSMRVCRGSLISNGKVLGKVRIVGYI